MRRAQDSKTLDMFAVPAAPRTVPGSQNISIEIRHLLSEVLKKCPKSRYEIAARMSELLGVEISKHQLDSWTADSRDGWRFPLEYMPALEQACDTHAMLEFIAGQRGCSLNIGDEAWAAKLGQLEVIKAETSKQISAIKKHLGGTA